MSVTAGLAVSILVLAAGVCATVLAGVLQVRALDEALERLEELERLVGVRHRPDS